MERNRIISGISRCIIAVETGTEGGTIHQVKIAMAQGRRVFTVKPKRTPIDSIKPVKEYLKKQVLFEKTKEKKIDSFGQNLLEHF